MERAKVTPDEIDLIILATITPDMPFPSTACLVQKKIGAARAAAFDIQAACSGFIFGLEIGQQFIMSRTYDTVLVIGAEKLSSIINWSDRNTCVLFGDGAGAAILRNRPGAHGLLTACMARTAGMTGLLVHARRRFGLPAHRRNHRRGDALPAHGRQGNIQERRHRHAHRGQRRPCAVANWTFRRSNASSPTRPTAVLLTPSPSVLGAKPEQVFVNLDKYGNTSAASVAIALDEAVQTGRIQRGDLVLLGRFRRRPDLGRGRHRMVSAANSAIDCGADDW